MISERKLEEVPRHEDFPRLERLHDVIDDIQYI